MTQEVNAPISIICSELEENQAAQEQLRQREKQLKAQIVEVFKDQLPQFGSMTGKDGTYKISITTPKKIEWDQKKLAILWDKIKSGNEDPADYIDLEYSVAERKYTAWPEVIKQEFIEARTLRAGTVSVKIERIEEQEHAA